MQRCKENLRLPSVLGWMMWYGWSILLGTLYLLLCIASGIQTGRIITGHHDLRSFQFTFHVLCFLWTLPRSVFFGSTMPLNRIAVLFLFWIPVDLQFSVYSLIILFYAYLVHRRHWELKRLLFFYLYILINVSMFSVTTVYIILMSRSPESSRLDQVHHIYMAMQFLVLLTIYGYYGYQLYNLALSGSVARLAYVKPTIILCITSAIFLVFLTRFVYTICSAADLWTIDIGGDEGGIKQIDFLAFTLMCLWEILPTSMLLIYFRKIPSNGSRCCLHPHMHQRADRLNSDGLSLNADSLEESLTQDEDGTTPVANSADYNGSNKHNTPMLS